MAKYLGRSRPRLQSSSASPAACTAASFERFAVVVAFLPDGVESWFKASARRGLQCFGGQPLTLLLLGTRKSRSEGSNWPFGPASSTLASFVSGIRMQTYLAFLFCGTVSSVSRPWLRPSLFGVPLVPARSDAFAMLTPSSCAVRLSTVPVTGRVLSFWKERIAARFVSSTTPSIFPGSYPLVFKASSTFLISSFDNSTVPCCIPGIFSSTGPR